MPPSLTRPPSSFKQDLLLEFASLKFACLHGVYMAISPAEPTSWSGVVFIRRGPYASAIIRLRVSFPPAYPASPPLVISYTDIFHPLLTPLTTHVYSPVSTGAETATAAAKEILPPGGFSLRHAFPNWFDGASEDSTTSVKHVSSSFQQNQENEHPDSMHQTSCVDVRASVTAKHCMTTSDYNIVEVLRYIRSTFDDVTVLDSVPYEAAANPGAWHAWCSHRRKEHPSAFGKTANVTGHRTYASDYGAIPVGTSILTTMQETETKAPSARSKPPAEWNWEGVWEERVKKGIQASLSESVLYGNAGGNDDLICFTHLDDECLKTLKGAIEMGTNMLPAR